MRVTVLVLDTVVVVVEVLVTVAVVVRGTVCVRMTWIVLRSVLVFVFAWPGTVCVFVVVFAGARCP